MANYGCKTSCENPRTIYCEYVRDECVITCESLTIPVGSILDYPIDYSDILGCEDVHIIDQAQSSVTITQTGGQTGAVTVSSTDYADSIMTPWIDATSAQDGAYYELEAVMVSDKGRRIVHRVSMVAKDVKCS